MQQILVAMDYSGNNTFTGGLGTVQARFEFGNDGTVKTVVKHPDENQKPITVEGTKFLKS